MSASGFFRIKKLKGPTIILAASRHNKRAIQSERGAERHIDATRIPLNQAIHGPESPEMVAQDAKDRMANAGVRPQKKNAVLGLELIFSLPPHGTIELERYFQDCLQWAGPHFGGLDNVLSADIHLDEAAPHLHVLILPLIDGRMKGSDLFGNRQRLQYLQNDFHCAVSGRYGLSKPVARLQGRAKEKTAQAVLNHIRSTNDPAQTSAVWSVLRDLIDREPAQFAQTLGLDIASPEPRAQRTMAQIFTSKGKGSRGTDRPIGFAQRSTPIGLATLPERQSLCSVGLAPLPASPQQAEGEGDRVVDRGDCDFTDWQDVGQLDPGAWQ